ncbi:MAG: SoxR reducing system RseC family protein [Prevotella sp.]|jgi:positive regulator of sigma E activity
MVERISHEGTVEHIEGDCLTVLIRQASACGSCQLAGHCNASEMKEKRVKAVAPKGRSYQVGETVTVSTALGTGYRAVAIGFGLPLLLMVAVMVAVKIFTGSDAWAAVSALGSLVPYYFVVYLLRDSINRSVTFVVDD